MTPALKLINMCDELSLRILLGFALRDSLAQSGLQLRVLLSH